MYISPHGTIFETSCRLDHFCTNNEAEYEALLLGLEILKDAGVTHVEAYGDSLLVVQQVAKVFQCNSGSLNTYLDRCLDIISNLDYFSISHVSRQDNWLANDLAQQASGYHISRGVFLIAETTMLADVNNSEAKRKAESSDSEAEGKAESSNSEAGGKAESSNS